jgi:hypothetical protein
MPHIQKSHHKPIPNQYCEGITFARLKLGFQVQVLAMQT